MGEVYAPILDRYWWSTWVYGLVEAEQTAWSATLPAVVFFVRRTSPFRPEQTKVEFLELVRLYDKLAQRAIKRHPVVSISNDDLESSIDTIRAEIDRLLVP